MIDRFFAQALDWWLGVTGPVVRGAGAVILGIWHWMCVTFGPVSATCFVSCAAVALLWRLLEILHQRSTHRATHLPRGYIPPP